MNDTIATRRLRLAAAAALALPILMGGCQHNRRPTTQVVFATPAAEPTATATPAPTFTPVKTTSSNSFSQTSQHTGHEVAQASRTAGHDVAQASRDAGHDVAQGSRATYHATANGVRDASSAVIDLTTRSGERYRNSPPESLSPPVMDIDPAMQVRDWNQATATYSSGAFVAGPVGFLYRPRDGQPQWHYSVVDVPMFLVDTVLMPVAFCMVPPWAPVEWKCVTVEPTFTAVPPLPPE